MDVGLRQANAQGVEASQEPLPPRIVERHPAGEHFEVQLLQEARVMALECVEFAGGGVTPMHLGERGSRGASMIEEGIVEIEQHRPRHYIPESSIVRGRVYSRPV